MLRDGGWEQLQRRIRTTLAAATGLGADLTRHAVLLERACQEIAAATDTARANADIVPAHASAYLEAVGHLVIAWLWLEQEIAADGKDEAFYAGKRLAAEFFFIHELPLVPVLLGPLADRDRLVIDLDTAVL